MERHIRRGGESIERESRERGGGERKEEGEESSRTHKTRSKTY